MVEHPLRKAAVGISPPSCCAISFALSANLRQWNGLFGFSAGEWRQVSGPEGIVETRVVGVVGF